jgi:hypothetical protein
VPDHHTARGRVGQKPRARLASSRKSGSVLRQRAVLALPAEGVAPAGVLADADGVDVDEREDAGHLADPAQWRHLREEGSRREM